MVVKSDTRIQLDRAMSESLARLKARAEIVDDRGTILGYFEPVDPDEEELYRKAALLFDREEIERSKAEDGPCRTTAEVLDRLRSMGPA
jgi:hypothetical protein